MLRAKTEYVYVPEIHHPPPISCGPEIQTPATTRLEVVPKKVDDADGVTWVGLSPAHYENLAVNIQSSIAALKGKNQVILNYRGCITDYNATLDAARKRTEEE